jgi:two-component system phosphate regulon sensor histidine kinase PhoR
MASSLFRRSLALFAAAVLVAAAVFAFVGVGVMGSAYADASSSALLQAAKAVAATFPVAALSNPAEAERICAATGTSSGFRLTLILPDGKVLADSEASPATMENHSGRPEVAKALAGVAALSRRTSATVGDDLLYAAAPIFLAGGGAAKTVGVLRLALREPSLRRALAPSLWAFVAAALVFAAAALAAAAAFSRMTARPLASLARAARAYGSGEAASATAGARAVRSDDPEEMRVLASTLDSMAVEIGNRVSAARKQSRELEAILDAMTEAVLALDSSLRVTIANPAAAALFGLDGDPAGRSLLEATRSSELQSVAADSLAAGGRRSREIALFLPTERWFQAFAAPLGAPAEGPGGLVIVLNDITELRRLERVRRDFVANVSHELRTPVQLVKGFAESLLEGALRDSEQAPRFLGIIERNAARMETLIADLLSLASLERDGNDWLRLERAAIGPVLMGAREAILPKAEARGTKVLVESEAGLSAKVDAGLLEQALVNLIDNAVKYSPPASVVSVVARSEDDCLAIEVKDQGIGIPARDLPRVFERFYRVDKARSRELGGTGLGLAIVRHVAMAHGGSVSVESWEGEGSTFRMRIPLG